jgi:hypothetical protein
MSADVGVAAPAGGLAFGVAALALWVSALSWRGLDVLVAGMLVAGVVAGGIGYARGRDTRTRRLAVVALGWNALGLLTLALLYASG